MGGKESKEEEEEEEPKYEPPQLWSPYGPLAPASLELTDGLKKFLPLVGSDLKEWLEEKHLTNLFEHLEEEVEEFRNANPVELDEEAQNEYDEKCGSSNDPEEPETVGLDPPPDGGDIFLGDKKKVVKNEINLLNKKIRKKLAKKPRNNEDEEEIVTTEGGGGGDEDGEETGTPEDNEEEGGSTEMPMPEYTGTYDTEICTEFHAYLEDRERYRQGMYEQDAEEVSARSLNIGGSSATALYIGAGVGTLLVIILCFVYYCCCCRRKGGKWGAHENRTGNSSRKSLFLKAASNSISSKGSKGSKKTNKSKKLAASKSSHKGLKLKSKKSKKSIKLKAKSKAKSCKSSGGGKKQEKSKHIGSSKSHQK